MRIIEINDIPALRGQVDVARMLIELGADATAQDNYGWTPLHFASHIWIQNVAQRTLVSPLKRLSFPY